MISAASCRGACVRAPLFSPSAATNIPAERRSHLDNLNGGSQERRVCWGVCKEHGIAPSLPLRSLTCDCNWLFFFLTAFEVTDPTRAGVV